MIELFRASAIPSNLLQSAAKGALSMPAAEMIEILVHLAQHNRVVRDKAKFTLAGWDEAACREVLKAPDVPKEVLEYFVAPENLRPGLLPELLENASVPENALAQLASTKSGEVVDLILQSNRANKSEAIRAALRGNHGLTEKQAAILAQMDSGPASTTALSETERNDPAGDQVVHAFMSEHAAELAGEPEKPFQPIGGIEEIHPSVTTPAVAVPAPVAVGSSGAAAAPALETEHHVAAAMKKTSLTGEEQRGSALQKISKLDIKGRISLAVKGTKEERSILIRDGTKIVALAVLESPKITDGEVEKFAGQKNVLEAVLRAIPMKRRFAKQYPVIRNLVFNPRTPIDMALGLMKNILVNDLRNLAGNKEVSDTIRKLALKMFKQKTEDAKKH
jgi:hypothetical protein